jgi:hypothetical protein
MAFSRLWRNPCEQIGKRKGGSGSFPLAGSIKLVNRDSCLLDSASESADGKLFMPRNNAPFIIATHYNMAAFLADLAEAEFCENPDGLIT